MSAKILVVEDSRYVRNLIVSVLETAGFNISEAENGSIGITKAREVLPDLILCDIEMPIVDGHGVLSAVRSEELTATTPFIFLTARDTRSDMRRGMTLGADDYITKPFTPQELLASVRTQLDKRAALTSHSEEKLDSLRGNIVHALPHELLTPLNGIIGFSEMVLHYGDTLDREEITDMASDILTSAKRLHRLIQNFLVYAQIEVSMADEQQIEAMRRNSISNPAAVIEVAANQKAVNVSRSDDLSLRLANEAVYISRNDLTKICTELLDNAFKFSEPDSPVSVTATTRGDTFQLRITDYGSGMESDEIANIGAYMQFDRKIREQQGSGLGLIIAKRLAELHGGTLTVESEPEQSTDVLVTLRRVAHSAATSSSPPATEETSDE